MTQSRTAKIVRDASPKYTENKRTTVKNSVTRRNSRKSERDEGRGSGGKSESRKGRVTRDRIYERRLTGGHKGTAFVYTLMIFGGRKHRKKPISTVSSRANDDSTI